MEELLSGNPHIEKESARSIADGAMMEAASVCVGQMVRPGAPSPPSSLRPPSPARSESVLLEGRDPRGLLATPAGPGAELRSETSLLSCPTRKLSLRSQPWGVGPGRGGWAWGAADPTG